MTSLLPRVAKLKEIALDFFFPKWCVGCGKAGDFICDSCRHTIIPIKPPVCPRCGSPQSGGTVCPGCTSWQASIDGIRSPFRFEGVMRPAVHSLKYRNLRALAPELGGMLFDYVAANPLPADVLVPVPLHPKRLRERGYNQSHLLANTLSGLTGLPLIGDCVIRLSHTPPQARTTKVAERRSNVVNAFACRDRRLEGKRVILIDDVSTSGATLDACAAAVKAAGAASAWGLTVAKEV